MMDIGDIVKVKYPNHPHEVKYVTEIGKIIGILGTTEDEKILEVEIMGLKEVLLEGQLKVVKHYEK